MRILVIEDNSDIAANITFRVTDSCGAYDDASFSVTFDLNDPPQCQVPGNMTVHQNCIPQQVSIPVGALDLQKSALALRRRILGDEHPDTLTAIVNLANTL